MSTIYAAAASLAIVWIAFQAWRQFTIAGNIRRLMRNDLSSWDHPVWWPAPEARLRRKGTRAVPALIRVAKRGELRALVLLGEIRDRRADTFLWETFETGSDSESSCAARSLMSAVSKEGEQLGRLLKTLEERLSFIVPANSRRQHEAASFLREAFRLRRKGLDFEFVFQAEQGHQETRSESAWVPKGHSPPSEADAIEVTYDVETWVVDEPEKVLLRACVGGN